MGHSEVVRVMLLRGADRDAARNVSAGDSCARARVVVPSMEALTSRLNSAENMLLYYLFSSPGFAPNLHPPFSGKTGGRSESVET